MSNTAQLSARERITTLFDENSFVEVGAFVTRRSTDFNLQEKEIPADGVITGYGVINGNLVYGFSQDAAALGGSMGEMHAKKISNIYDLALKVGAPVVGLIDSSGFRLQEATDALHGFGEIYLKQTLASGVIPQITAILGTSGGGLAVMASLSDFVFMEQNSKLFVNSPNALSGNYTDKLDTTSAKFQARSGLVDYVGETENDVLKKIRELLSILPNNNDDDTSYEECNDDLNRLTPEIEACFQDPQKVFQSMSDNHFFYEIKTEYAKEMVTGFIRLNGMTIGALGNRIELLNASSQTTETFDGTLTTQGCYKAEHFINFCDAFGIPVLTLTNVNGYKATIEEEQSIGKAAAKLTYAFANATVPKVNVITGKAYGSAYVTMNSKHIGADLVFALPNSEIGLMDGYLAAQIMYTNQDRDTLKEKAAIYTELQSSPMAAAKRGYVDHIIEPETLRKHMVYSYEMLFTKTDARPNKKHGTV